MGRYNHSDYAVNKFSKGIVYRFAGRTVEVTLEDYLAENPDGTVEAFQLLKAASDAIYRRQDPDTYNQCRRFERYVFQGISLRQIAELEKVDRQAVWQSLHAVRKKIVQICF